GDAVDLLPIEFDDDISRIDRVSAPEAHSSQARLLRWSARTDAHDGRARYAELACDRSTQPLVGLNTEAGRGIVAFADELGDDTVDRIDGHGKSNSGAGTGGAENCRIHTYEATRAVEQRATGIARVDGRVCLHEVLDESAILAGERAV